MKRGKEKGIVVDHFERNFVKDCFVVVLLLDGKRNEKEKEKGCHGKSRCR